MAKEKEKDIFGVPAQRDNTSVKQPIVPEAPDTSNQLGPHQGLAITRTFLKSITKKKKNNDMFGVGGGYGREVEEERRASQVEKIAADDNMPENEVKPPKKEEE